MRVEQKSHPGGSTMRAFWLAALLVPLVIVGCGTDSQHSTYGGVLEGRSIQVPALTGGRIVGIFVDTGHEVSSGDTLAIIETTDLVLEDERLRAILEELEVEGDIASTDLDRTRADLDYVREKEGRIQTLYEKQATARQDLDDLLNEMQRAESAYEEAGQRVRKLVARRKQLEAQIGSIRKKISDATIVAPVDGLVGTRYYENGEAIPPLRPIVELIHVSELEVKIYISEKRLSEIRHGQEVTIRVDGLEEELLGRISWVSPKAEFTPKNVLTPETRTSLVYAVKVTVSNPTRVLKHGMPVEVIL